MSDEQEQGVPPTGSGHSDEPASGLAANAGSVPNAEFRIVALQLSKRDGSIASSSMLLSWGCFDSEEAAIGAAMRRVPELKPDFSVDQYLVTSPFAQGIEAGTDETPQAAQSAGREPDPVGDAPVTPPPVSDREPS